MTSENIQKICSYLASRRAAHMINAGWRTLWCDSRSHLPNPVFPNPMTLRDKQMRSIMFASPAGIANSGAAVAAGAAWCRVFSVKIRSVRLRCKYGKYRRAPRYPKGPPRFFAGCRWNAQDTSYLAASARMSSLSSMRINSLPNLPPSRTATVAPFAMQCKNT